MAVYTSPWNYLSARSKTYGSCTYSKINYSAINIKCIEQVRYENSTIQASIQCYQISEIKTHSYTIINDVMEL